MVFRWSYTTFRNTSFLYLYIYQVIKANRKICFKTAKLFLKMRRHTKTDICILWPTSQKTCWMEEAHCLWMAYSSHCLEGKQQFSCRRGAFQEYVIMMAVHEITSHPHRQPVLFLSSHYSLIPNCNPKWEPCQFCFPNFLSFWRRWQMKCPRSLTIQQSCFIPTSQPTFSSSVHMRNPEGCSMLGKDLSGWLLIWYEVWAPK